MQDKVCWLNPSPSATPSSRRVLVELGRNSSTMDGNALIRCSPRTAHTMVASAPQRLLLRQSLQLRGFIHCRFSSARQPQYVVGCAGSWNNSAARHRSCGSEGRAWRFRHTRRLSSWYLCSSRTRCTGNGGQAVYNARDGRALTRRVRPSNRRPRTSRSNGYV
jgi:hypothetical protein